MRKRDEIPDSKIMDALDAEEYNIKRAAARLGIKPNTLYKWIKDSENLKKYVDLRIENDAVRARDKLSEMLEYGDALDPRQMGHIISICKILLDKAEADRQSLDISQQTTHKIDKELQDKIRDLLDE